MEKSLKIAGEATAMENGHQAKIMSKIAKYYHFQLHETYCSICKKRQVSQISQEDCLSLCNLLESRGIISMKRAKETRMAKVGKI